MTCVAPSHVPPSTDTLVERITLTDRTLCRMMAQERGPLTHADTGQARALIEETEPARASLARRTVEGLCRWLEADGRRRFQLPPERLQARLMCTGLARVLDHLARAKLNGLQRRCIGEVLRDAGAHVPTLRARLRLGMDDLQHSSASALIDRLMTDALAAELQLEAIMRPGLADDTVDPQRLAQRRTETWHSAAMVNHRFGYTASHPAWKYMRNITSSQRARMYLLGDLSRAPEAQRRGIDVQLP
jgi:hypothetical protein